jgi:lauroyl/myristoyl acyltransferase
MTMRHRIEYLLVRALMVLVRLAPGPLVRAGGTLVGLAFYTFDRAHRRIARRNLAAAFPGRPPAERRTSRRPSAAPLPGARSRISAG